MPVSATPARPGQSCHSQTSENPAAKSGSVVKYAPLQSLEALAQIARQGRGATQVLKDGLDGHVGSAFGWLVERHGDTSAGSQFWLVIVSRARRPRRTFSRIESALAVHTNGVVSSARQRNTSSSLAAGVM